MTRKKFLLPKPPQIPAERDVLGIMLGFLAIHVWTGLSFWLYATMALALAGALFPRLATGISQSWRLITRGIGWVNSKVLLTLLYVLILTPIAWISRLRREDPFFLRHTSDSYYQVLDKRYRASDLKDLW